MMIAADGIFERADPMRVIFVNRYFFPDQSATSQMVTQLVFGLDERERLALASHQLYADPKAGLPVQESVDGVTIHRVRTTRFGRTRLAGRLVDYVSFYALATARLARIARSGDVVVVCTDPPLFSVLAAGVCRLRGAKLVNWLHDLFPEVAISLGVIPEKRALARFLCWLRDLGLKSAAVNVVIGRRMSEYMDARGIPRTKVQAIANWADGQALVPVAREANPLRAAWGIGDKFVIGYSGNFGRAHEFETLLDAATRLNHRDDIVFLLIGHGYYRDHVVAEVKKRGLRNVQMRPFQPLEALPNSLGLADLHLISLRPDLEPFVTPSKFYGIAAAGRGAIFVGDARGEVAMLLDEHRCGVTVAAGAGDLLAERITGLAADRALVAQWGRNARTAFEAGFDRPVAINAWRTLLDRLSPLPAATPTAAPAAKARADADLASEHG